VDGAEGGTLASKRAREANRSALLALQQLVLRLSGCLAALPYEDRLALQLSSGVGVARPLDPLAVAAYMHIGTARLAALERSALHELVQASRGGGCGAAWQPFDALRFLSSLEQPFAGLLPALGGPEAVGLARAARPAGVSPTTDPLLGIDISPEARVLLIALLAAGSALLLWLLFSDRFELGTRVREWRFRRTHGPRA
jgi:hypothetical protein